MFFAPRTALAPMEGVTDPTFRDLITEYGGVGMVCTEFVRITDQSCSPTRLEDAVHRSAGVALSVQVMGRNVERMAEAAEIVDRAGADVVDINLGCPTRRAVARGVGAALLREPELLSRLLDRMRQRVRGRLSAKVRAGFDNPEHALDIARRVQEAGADFITIHPRLRTDQYRGVADWRIVELLAAQLQIPVIGNGDLWYAADALRLQEQAGCAAVMIGRPALRNPWIFRQVAELRAGRAPFQPEGHHLVRHAETLHQRLQVAFPGAKLEGRLKELCRWMLSSIRDGGVIRRRVLHTPSAAELLALLREEVAPLRADQLDLGAHGPQSEDAPPRPTLARAAS